MTDKEARILDACTIADFYTIFDEKKKPCAGCMKFFRKLVAVFS